MTELGALFLYWAVVLVVLTEVRRELGGRRDGRRSRGRGLTVLLYAVLTVTVAGAVVLTGLRLAGKG